MNKYNTKQHTCVECGGSFAGRKKKYCSKECSDEVRRRKNRERMRKVNPPKPDVTIICEWCGELHTVPARTAHQARFCSAKCRQRARDRANGHIPWEEWKTRVTKQKQERLAKLKKERAIKLIRDTLVKVRKHKQEKERIKELTKECAECSRIFYNPIPNTVTCSQECRRKRNNRMRKMYEGNRLNKHNIIDKDITLEKLYKRDKGICYLCGEPCDYNDKLITDEGHYIVGETYPSIDHVKPLSKGGKHSWENVKLAHHRCNTLKSDNKIKGNFKALANS